VFEELNLQRMSGIISISAVVAMASVLLVFQMGQPRIWMSMSRDGLLPKRFSKIHPKYKTPSFATIVVGFVVAVPALFMNLTMVTDLCSIGTLFAFVLVCGGVLVLQNKPDIPRGKFKTPYANGKYFMPLLLCISLVILITKYKTETIHFVLNQSDLKTTSELLIQLSPKEAAAVKNRLLRINAKEMSRVGGDIEAYYSEMSPNRVSGELRFLDKPTSFFVNSGWTHFFPKLPSWIFIVFTFFITVMAVLRNLSLIPTLGLLSCLYMMSQIALRNWIYFTVWLLIGLVIYFLYGRKKSKLN